MKLTTLLLTKNDCYKSGRKHTVKGIMWHSTGANNPKLSRYVGPDDGVLGPNTSGTHWNQPKPGGRSVCVHAFIGKDKNGEVRTYQTLPWDMVGWHSGSGSLGSSKNANNNGYIGFEICEDDLRDPVYFAKAYQEAIDLTVYLCKKYNIEVNNKTVICHSEGHKQGIASNHADVMHWFPKYGKSMDTVRADVKRALAAESKPADPKPDGSLFYVQTGAYKNKTNADTQYNKVRAAGFEAIIKQTGDLYRVQVGAYSKKENAEAMAEKIRSKGFEVYITNTGGTQVAAGATPKTPTKTLKVGSKVGIKSSATNYATGQKIPSWVKGKTYTVQQLGSGKVLLKEIVSWVNTGDLTIL